MATVTRTLKNGGDTGKLDRAEVRAVTAAIAEGRTADVLSGAVLKQFRAARKGKSMPKAIRRRADGKIVSVTVSSEREASEKVKTASRSKK